MAAFGEVHYFGAVSFDKRYVGIVPAANADIVYYKPFAIRTPFKRYVTVGIRIVVFAIKSSGYFLGINIYDLKNGAVFKKRHFFAVRTEFRLLSGCRATVERLFLNFCGIGEFFFILVFDFGNA